MQRSDPMPRHDLIPPSPSQNRRPRLADGPRAHCVRGADFRELGSGSGGAGSAEIGRPSLVISRGPVFPEHRVRDRAGRVGACGNFSERRVWGASHA
jgi:hypothetical protein